MGKIKINIPAADVEKGLSSGDFVDPPPGLYVVEVRSAEEKTKEGGEHPYINVQAVPKGRGKANAPLNPPEGERFGSVWDRVSLSPAAKWRLTNFCLAMGLKVNAKGEIVGTLELEEGKPGSIIGKLALLRVKERKDGQREGYQAEAGNWAPYEADDSGTDGFTDDDGDGFEDAPEEEPESLDEPFDGDDEPGEDEYYTEESLGEMDNDELKAAAAEFDLDVKDYVVKNRAKKTDVPKTRAAIIAAILEAQGVEDDGEEEPF